MTHKVPYGRASWQPLMIVCSYSSWVLLRAGIATSLKVLFAAEDCGSASGQPQQLQLERNEVIAMLNLLERLSASIEAVRELSLQLADGNWEQQHPQGLGAIQDFTHNSLYQSL